MNENAVIVRAGRNSRHAEWLGGGRRNFDLIVLRYEALDDARSRAADAIHEVPGWKVHGWSVFFARHPELLERYARFALMDDDLSCSAPDINAAFELGRQHRLSLWQPSLTPDSFFTYSVFQHNPLFRLRYVNYIEMMCPFMTAETLGHVLPLFGLGYETGIDRLWCCVRASHDKAYAVLDEVSVRHTRRVGENSAAQGFVGENAAYQTVLEEMERRLERPYTGTVAYAGITKAGRLIEDRRMMALASLVPLKDARKNPSPKYLKRFLISLRHNLTRPINNDQIDMDLIVDRLKRA